MCALHIIMHSYLVHNTAKNSSDNLPSYPPDNQRSSDVVYWRGRQGHSCRTGAKLLVPNNAILTQTFLFETLILMASNSTTVCSLYFMTYFCRLSLNAVSRVKECPITHSTET